MTSEPTETLVWTWPAGAEEPVVAGRIELAHGVVTFNYGRSYLARTDAVALYLPELPLRPGAIEPLGGLTIPGCIKDAGPDAWGQRVVMQHLLGTGAKDEDPVAFGPLTYLLRSGSDRIGALDFQERSDVYVGRDDSSAPLEELMQAADRVEMMARYASYADLAQVVRERFTDARTTLRELFARITFNILTGNSDDHARNHAALWDGEWLTLTPAYDIWPQPRGGGETSQSMIIGPDGFRLSNLVGCVERASTYMLTEGEARELIDHQADVIGREWDEVCERARMTKVKRSFFWRRQFLNPYALEGYAP